MFRPPYTRVEDLRRIREFVNAYPFGILITQGDDHSPFATHIPFLLQEGDGGHELTGHVAKANPHWKAWDGKRQALVIFHGPHGYVSPSWYGEHPAVPTWNYAAVHAYGRPRALKDEAQLWPLLQQLIDAFESGRVPRWRADLPSEYRAKMVAGIVGVTIPVERWEAKFKLSQNRGAGDRERVIERLEASSFAADRELGTFMRAQTEVVFPERHPSVPGSGVARPPSATGGAKRDTIADLD